MDIAPHGITPPPTRMPAPPPGPEALIRAVAGAVTAVNANLRLVNAAIAAGHAPDLSRAMAALNAAFTEQGSAARIMLKRMAAED